VSLEIERRFVARVAQEVLDSAPHREQRQGYLTRRDPATVRIRQEGETWVLAVKVDAGPRARHEIEVDVPADEGRILLAAALGGTVEKTRFDVGRWEVDLYRGRYEGLIIAEVELESPDEPLPDAPPGLELLREITDETGLSSRGLALLDDAGARAIIARLMG
jgi:CYTH domain-containing protein